MDGSTLPETAVDAVERAFPATSFPALCESVAEFGYVALRDLVEQLVEQRSSDVDAAEKNVLVIDVSQRERHRLLRLLTLFRWLRQHHATLRRAQLCVTEADWLANRFERAGADVLWSMHQQLRAGPLFAAPLDVPAAATVATTGSYDRLPLVLHVAKSSAALELQDQAIRILGNRTYLLLREAASSMHVQLHFSPRYDKRTNRASVTVSDRNMPGWSATVGLGPVSVAASLPSLPADTSAQSDWEWIVWKVSLERATAYATLAAHVVQTRYLAACRKRQVTDLAGKTRFFLASLVSCLSVELYEPLRVASLAASVETLMGSFSSQTLDGREVQPARRPQSTIRLRRLKPPHAHFQVLYWPSTTKPPIAEQYVQMENCWWHAINVQCVHLGVPSISEWLWDPSHRLQVLLHGYIRVGHRPPLPAGVSVDMAPLETGDGVALVAQVRRARASALLRAIASGLPPVIQTSAVHPCLLRLQLPGDDHLAILVQVREQDGMVSMRLQADDLFLGIRNMGGFMDPSLPAWLDTETWPVWLPVSDQRERILGRFDVLQQHALGDQIRMLRELWSWHPYPVYLMPGKNRLQLAVKLSSGSYFVPVGNILAALTAQRATVDQGSCWMRAVARAVDILRRFDYLTSAMREKGMLAAEEAIHAISWSEAMLLAHGQIARLKTLIRLSEYKSLSIQNSWLDLEPAGPDRSPWSVELDIPAGLFDCCTDSTAIDGESSAGQILVALPPTRNGDSEATEASAAEPIMTLGSERIQSMEPLQRCRMHLHYPHATASWVQHLAWDLTRASRLAALLQDSNLSRARIRRTGNFFHLERLTPARLLVRLGDTAKLVITYRCHIRPLGYIVAFRKIRGSLEFATRLMEEVLNAQPCYTVLYGLLERTLPLALAAEAAFHGRQVRFRFLSALRLRIVLVDRDDSSRTEVARNHVMELDAKESSGFVRIVDIGAQKSAVSSSIPVAPLPGWHQVRPLRSKTTESVTNSQSIRVPLGELERVLVALASTSSTATG